MVLAKPARPKQIVIAISIIILMVLPLLRLPLVHALAQSSLTVEVKDANQDGFPDVEFHATDGDNAAIKGVQIDLTPWNFSQAAAPGTQPMFSGSTNDSGIVLFKTIPSGNFTISHGDLPLSPIGTNTTLVGDVLTISPDQISLNVTSDQELLIEAIAIGFMANRTDKGRALMEGLAEVFNYSVPLPPPQRFNATSGQCANDACYLKARDYVVWLDGLKNILDAERGVMPVDVWKAFNVITSVDKYIVTGHLKFYLGNTFADEVKLATSGNELDPQTGYTLADKALHERREFSGFSKAMGVLLIVLGVTDLVVLIGSGRLTWDVIGDPAAHVIVLLEFAKDLASIASGIANLAVSAGRAASSGLAIGAATAVTGVLAIALAVAQAWDLATRYKGSWGLFLNDLYSGNIELLVELAQIAGGALLGLGLVAGLIGFAAASAVTGVGLVLSVVAAIAAFVYLFWSLGEFQKQLDKMRFGLTGQLSNLYQIRESLSKMDPELLRDQGNMSASYATAAGEVAEVTPSQFRGDFLWLRHYFARLSSAQLSLAANVDSARQATDNLLKAFVYNSTGTTVFAGYLQGYNSTKVEFTGSTGLPGFTFNATIYGRQADGSLGFKRHDISWSPGDDSQKALNGTFATEPSLANVIKWGFQPKNESGRKDSFLSHLRERHYHG